MIITIHDPSTFEPVKKRIWHSTDFLANPGPEGRGYGAEYCDGIIVGSGAAHAKQAFPYYENEEHYITRMVSAQIGDRMVCGVVKNFSEIEDWILAETKSTVIHWNSIWYFADKKEKFLFTMRWWSEDWNYT